jgi:hypothetical protein
MSGGDVDEGPPLALGEGIEQRGPIHEVPYQAPGDTRRVCGTRAAKLDPAMRLETFTRDSPVRYDRQLSCPHCAFLDDARGAHPGPVGVGKTHLATALGHIAVRRRRTVRFLRADEIIRGRLTGTARVIAGDARPI